MRLRRNIKSIFGQPSTFTYNKFLLMINEMNVDLMIIALSLLSCFPWSLSLIWNSNQSIIWRLGWSASISYRSSLRNWTLSQHSVCFFPTWTFIALKASFAVLLEFRSCNNTKPLRCAWQRSDTLFGTFLVRKFDFWSKTSFLSRENYLHTIIIFSVLSCCSLSICKRVKICLIKESYTFLATINHFLS